VGLKNAKTTFNEIVLFASFRLIPSTLFSDILMSVIPCPDRVTRIAGSNTITATIVAITPNKTTRLALKNMYVRWSVSNIFLVYERQTLSRSTNKNSLLRLLIDMVSEIVKIGTYNMATNLLDE
jgi:hypothetical protein